MAQRPDRPLVIVDVAVPRDVDPEVREVPGCTLFDVDDLASAREASMAARRLAAADAEAQIERTVERFMAWWHGRTVAAVVADLVAHAERVRQAEVERSLARLGAATERERALVEATSAAIVKKLLHQPIVELKRRGAEDEARVWARALGELFALPSAIDEAAAQAVAEAPSDRRAPTSQRTPRASRAQRRSRELHGDVEPAGSAAILAASCTLPGQPKLLPGLTSQLDRTKPTASRSGDVTSGTCARWRLGGDRCQCRSRPKLRGHRDASAALEARATQVIPGGVNSPVRAFKAVGGGPVFMRRGSGCTVEDVDGNTYIDYLGSWGPLILGHAHPAVVAAVQEAAADGTSFGAPTEREVLLAEAIRQALPSIEQVRLVSSGTEACMSALRVARAFTGRSKILKFDGCYHGHADSLLVKAGSGAITFGTPDSAGVSEGVASETISVPYNNLDAVRSAFAAYGAEIAAVIVEPIAANMGVIPPAAGFLDGLREITTQAGALLIFDEVVSGFRYGPDGAQGAFGIKPDLTCARQDRRRRPAAGGVRRPARDHGDAGAARAGLSGWHALGEPDRDGGRPGHPPGARRDEPIRRA